MRKNIIMFIFIVLSITQIACSNNELTKIENESGSNSGKQDEYSSLEESENKNDETIKDIIFLNYLPDTTAAEEAGMSTNYLDSDYISTDDDSMYAYTVYFKNYHGDTESNVPSDYPVQRENELFEDYQLRETEYRVKKSVDIMKRNGLTILSDYPFCSYNQKDIIPGNGYKDKLALGLCAVAGTMEEIKSVFDNTAALDGWTCCVWAAPRPDLIDIMKDAGWEMNENQRYSMIDWYVIDFEKISPLLGDENQVTMSVEVE